MTKKNATIEPKRQASMLEPRAQLVVPAAFQRCLGFALVSLAVVQPLRGVILLPRELGSASA
eukprot:1407599-Pleurochrysis_carterae.AAC.2